MGLAVEGSRGSAAELVAEADAPAAEKCGESPCSTARRLARGSAAEGFGVVQARFWLDDDYGIIRQRRAPGLLWHPELWRDGRWFVGSPYVIDAITGGSDDGWWGCPSADPLGAAAAARYAAEHGVELLADNPDDPHAEYGPASVAG